MACFVIVQSDIPLAPSFLLLHLGYRQFLEHGFLVTPLTGAVDFHHSGYHEYKQNPFPVNKVIFLIDKLGLLFVLSDGRRFMLWRDSIDEAEYRHLIVWLKREH